VSSEVEICKLALSHIRGGSINSLTEPSAQAQQCSLHYPVARDMCLRNGPWGFATRTERLALLSTAEAHNYAYVYAYPSQCLEIHRVALDREDYAAQERTALHRDVAHVDLRRQVPYEAMNVKVGTADTHVIAANEADLWAVYTRRVTDPNFFDAHFILALSHLLAANIAMSIIGSREGAAARQAQMSLYSTLMSEAAARDRNQRFIPQPDSEFVTVRR